MAIDYRYRIPVILGLKNHDPKGGHHDDRSTSHDMHRRHRRTCSHRACRNAASAADIISEWTSVKLPPAPELKPVTVDGRTTALLILDFMKEGCNRRPRCLAIVPGMKKLHDAARANGAMLFYSLVGGTNPTARDVVEGLTPKEGEWVFQRGPDKFLGSPLEARLKDRGIRTVIVTGVSAQGVGIGTGSGAAQRGYKVIVPVDGLAADEAFMELYAAYHLAKGGPAIVTEQVTLTKTDMIKF
jgi:nicotinamidase-related amidase